MSFMAG
jgi:hypothetical protein